MCKWAWNILASESGHCFFMTGRVFVLCFAVWCFKSCKGSESGRLGKIWYVGWGGF